MTSTANFIMYRHAHKPQCYSESHTNTGTPAPIQAVIQSSRSQKAKLLKMTYSSIFLRTVAKNSMKGVEQYIYGETRDWRKNLHSKLRGYKRSLDQSRFYLIDPTLRIITVKYSCRPVESSSCKIVAIVKKNDITQRISLYCVHNILYYCTQQR